MRTALVLLASIMLFLAGCRYESPLSKEHGIPVDASVLGLWEMVPEGDKKPDSNERMLVLKYSDTEYLVQYPMGKDGMYFRAYAMKIEGVSCVQLELIGIAEGTLEKGEKTLFHVASYQLVKGNLEIKILNSDLVPDSMKDAEALRKAFVKNKDHKDLFTNPGVFRRVKGKQ